MKHLAFGSLSTNLVETVRNNLLISIGAGGLLFMFGADLMSAAFIGLCVGTLVPYITYYLIPSHGLITDTLVDQNTGVTTVTVKLIRHTKNLHMAVKELYANGYKTTKEFHMVIDMDDLISSIPVITENKILNKFMQALNEYNVTLSTPSPVKTDAGWILTLHLFDAGYVSRGTKIDLSSEEKKKDFVMCLKVASLESKFSDKILDLNEGVYSIGMLLKREE
jgi:hypothetical protein